MDRKYLIIAGIAIILLAVIIGYHTGYDNGKKEAEEFYHHRKGNGKHFYVENDERHGIIYHSLPDCYKAYYGVKRDIFHYRNGEPISLKFCDACMDSTLIEKCFNMSRN